MSDAYPRVSDEAINFVCADIEANQPAYSHILENASVKMYFDARDARAMLAERDAQIAELQATIKRVESLTRYELDPNSEWEQSDFGPVISFEELCDALDCK